MFMIYMAMYDFSVNCGLLCVNSILKHNEHNTYEDKKCRRNHKLDDISKLGHVFSILGKMMNIHVYVWKTGASKAYGPLNSSLPKM